MEMVNKLDEPFDKSKIQIRTEFEVRNADNNIVANCTIYFRGGVLWFSDLWVNEANRGSGIAHAFLEQVIEIYGNQDIYLQVGPYSDRAKSEKDLVKFYKKFGFKKSSTPTIMKRSKS